MASMTGSPWDYSEPPAPRPSGEEWIDRLTALQVLSRHGDTDAELRVREWVADDPDARRLCDTVAQTCRHLDGWS